MCKLSSKKRLLVILALSASFVFTALLSLCFANGSFARAEDVSTPTLIKVTPVSGKEVFDFSDDKPVDAVALDESMVFFTENKNLYAYSSSTEQYVKVSDVKNPSQIKKFSGDKFILNDEYRLFLGQVGDGDVQLTDLSIPAGYIDVSEKYLVNRVVTDIKIYPRLSDGSIGDLSETKIKCNDLTPIAINDAGLLFYITGKDLHCCDLTTNNDFLLSAQVSAGENTALIADEEYVYFTGGGSNKIYRIPIDGGRQDELKNNGDFDLDTLSEPSSISFNGDNLLVTDKQKGFIAEYAINGDKLSFTGYAVSKGNSAFNRISSTVKDVVRDGDEIAVLDVDKLSIIKHDKNFNYKDRNCYTNYTAEAVGTPAMMSYGNGKVLLGYRDGSVSLRDATNASEGANAVGVSGVLKDLGYFYGDYYALTDDGDKTVLFVNRGGETDASGAAVFSPVVTLIGAHGKTFTVDLDKNAYVLSETAIYVNSQELTANNVGATMLSTDLNRNLFVASGQTIYYYDVDGKTFKTSATFDSNVSGFYMGFDKTSVYATFVGEEFLYVINGIGNAAIDSAETQSSLTDRSNAVLPVELKGATVDGDCVCFYVTADEGLTFNSITSCEGQYVTICKVVSHGVNGDVSFYALADRFGIILVNADYLTKYNIEVFDVATKAVVTTGVNVYALPIISKQDLFAMTDASGVIRLDKGTKLTTLQKITAVDREFYYCTFKYGDATLAAYVPTSFTTDKLTEEYVTQTYTYEKINPTDVFLDKDLTDKIYTITEAVNVKIYQKADKVALISAEIDGQTIYGYVDASSVVDEPNKAIRNILIALVAITCACGTTTYFLLRKKVKG